MKGTPKRARREVETTEYAAFARRMMRAFGKRVAQGDEIDLAELKAVRDEMEEVMVKAVSGMRAQGFSWAYIGQGLGVSRQAAQQAYGSKVAASPLEHGQAVAS